MHWHFEDIVMSYQRRPRSDEVNSPNFVPTGADRPGEEGTPSKTPGSAAAAVSARAAGLRENIHRLVSERGINLNRMAKLSGMPQANRLYNFLSGRSGSLSMGTVLQLSQALGVTVDELLGPPPRPMADSAAGGGAVASPGEPPLADRTAPASDARQAFDRLSASLDAVRFVLDAAAVATAEASKAAKAMVFFN
jgi:transcriptional regulator with XRE-family HTH domain